MNETAASHPTPPPYEKMATNNTILLKKLQKPKQREHSEQ